MESRSLRRLRYGCLLWLWCSRWGIDSTGQTDALHIHEPKEFGTTVGGGLLAAPATRWWTIPSTCWRLHNTWRVTGLAASNQRERHYGKNEWPLNVKNVLLCRRNKFVDNINKFDLMTHLICWHVNSKLYCFMAYLETMSLVCPLLGVTMDSRHCFMAFAKNSDPYRRRN